MKPNTVSRLQRACNIGHRWVHPAIFAVLAILSGARASAADPPARAERSQIAAPSAEQVQMAQKLHNQGISHIQNKRYDEALVDLTNAIKLNPQFADAYFTRSSVYVAKKDRLKALADLTKAIAINPENVVPRYNRALLYEELRQYDNAIADYTRIVGNKSDTSRFGDREEKLLALAYHSRGKVYHWHKKDYLKAIADYNDALELDPQISMVHYRRGQAYHAMKAYEDAQADFQAALTEMPGYANVLLEWAWQLATCPDLHFRDGKKAIELARQAVNSRGTKSKWAAPAVDALAAAFAENRQFREAIEWERKAIELLGTKDSAKRKAMQARLTLYEAGKPFREN